MYKHFRPYHHHTHRWCSNACKTYYKKHWDASFNDMQWFSTRTPESVCVCSIKCFTASICVNYFNISKDSDMSLMLAYMHARMCEYYPPRAPFKAYTHTHTYGKQINISMFLEKLFARLNNVRIIIRYSRDARESLFWGVTRCAIYIHKGRHISSHIWVHVLYIYIYIC